MTYPFFCFFGFTICIHFFIKKRTFYQFIFLICKMYTFDQQFGSKSLTQQNSRLFFFTNQFCTFCVNLLCNGILLMHTTYRSSTFSVQLQLKDFISENKVKIKVKIGDKGSISLFEKITSTVTYCFITLLNSALNFMQYM